MARLEEKGGKRGKRKRGNDDDDTEESLGVRKRIGNKKFKKKGGKGFK